MELELEVELEDVTCVHSPQAPDRWRPAPPCSESPSDPSLSCVSLRLALPVCDGHCQWHWHGGTRPVARTGCASATHWQAQLALAADCSAIRLVQCLTPVCVIELCIKLEETLLQRKIQGY